MGNQRAEQLMRELCRLAGYAKNKLTELVELVELAEFAGTA